MQSPPVSSRYSQFHCLWSGLFYRSWSSSVDTSLRVPASSGEGVAGGIAVAANKGTAAVITGSFPQLLPARRSLVCMVDPLTVQPLWICGDCAVCCGDKREKLEDIQQLFKITPCHSHKR